MSELLKREEFEEAEEGFRCDSDQKAEWCIKKLREAENEKAHWKAHFDAQYKGIAEQCDVTIETMKGFLLEYFKTVPHKKTKTQENYPLPSGKLVLKQVEPDYQRDEKKVIEWLKKNGGEKYIKVEEKLDWQGLKKTLTVIGETVADEDGQIIDCIKAIEQPDKFGIEK